MIRFDAGLVVETSGLNFFYRGNDLPLAQLVNSARRSQQVTQLANNCSRKVRKEKTGEISATTEMQSSLYSFTAVQNNDFKMYRRIPLSCVTPVIYFEKTGVFNKISS